MPVGNRVVLIAALIAGFGLVLAGFITAVFVVPDLRSIPHRVELGLAAIAACGAGIFVIAKSASRLERFPRQAEPLHIPGLDTTAKGIKPRM
jgi:hypothetical protein